MNPTVKPTSRALVWLWRFAAAIVLAVLLAFLAVFRVSPVFRSTERLLAEWANTNNNQAVRDQCLLLAYARLGDRLTENRHRFIIPVLLPTLIRMKRTTDFDKMLAMLTPEERVSPATVEAVMACVDEMAKRGDLAWINKYYPVFYEYWQGNDFADRYRRVIAKLRDDMTRAQQLGETIAGLETDLAAGPLAEDNRWLLQFRRQLLEFPPEDPDSASMAGVSRDSLLEPAMLFLVRAIGLQPGTMDLLGDMIIRGQEMVHSTAAVTQGINGSLLQLQDHPERWAEWQRFVELIAKSDNPGLRCVHDYSAGFLALTLEKNSAKARKMLEEGVLKNPACQGMMHANARELLKKVDQPPVKP